MAKTTSTYVRIPHIEALKSELEHGNWQPFFIGPTSFTNMDHKKLASLGGKALAAKLTKEQRKQSSAHALKVRWDRYRARKQSKNKS